MDERQRKRARLFEILIRQGWSPPRPNDVIVARIAADIERVNASQRKIPQFRSSLELTPFETRALAFAAAGYTQPQTAARLGISAETVKSTISNAREKLGARNVTHAVAICIRAGVIE